MTLMKGALAGVALGALALATIMLVAPIAAQGPGVPGDVPGDPGPRGAERPGGPGPTGPGMGRDTGPGMPGRRGDMGPGMDRGDMGMMGRRGFDPNDPDITGPRGEVGFCQERLTRMAQWRLERIQRLVRPTDDQRSAFEELRMASAKALEIMRSACPGERPLTPPGRMAAAEKWLEARLLALKTLRPALDAFYRMLSDEQKIRWSQGAFHGGWDRERDGWRMWGRPAPEDLWRDQRGWDDHGWRDQFGWRPPGGERLDPWDRRGFDRRDQFGFDRRDDRGRGSEIERFGQRWREDDRYGRGDERWREQERNRWREPRGRDPREWRGAPDEERP